MPAGGCSLGLDIEAVSLITAATAPAVASPSNGSRIASMLEVFFNIGDMRHHQAHNLLGRFLHRLAGDIHNWPPMGFAEV